MKVIHVLYDNIYSGAQNVACQIVNMFNEYESETEMVYVSPDGPIREALKARGVRFRALESFTAIELRRVISEEKPDLIHAHDMRASVISALASGKIPLISHIHNNNFDSRRISLKAILFCFAAHKAKHIFWVSRSSLEGFAFTGVVGSKSSVLYNIIDRKKIHDYVDGSSGCKTYDIVYVGRLTYQKNPERLIRVFSYVAEADINATMAIIGDGELKETVEKIIVKLPETIRERISLLGYINNPYGIIEKSKIMLMTSRWEGTPMCVLEAQELGVPLVSTPSDGIAEIIKHGENGYLETEDKALAERCIELIGNVSSYDHMRNSAKEFSSRYNDRKKYYNSISRVYKNAIKEKME